MRLPDVVVIPAEVSSRGALDAPPLIAIEVLSPEDAYSDLRQRTSDLRALGTEKIWLIDPAERSVAIWDGLTWQLSQGENLQATGTAAHLDLAWPWKELS